MTEPHTQAVVSQFGPRAQEYVESAVHAHGKDLDILTRIVGSARPRHALDLGTGGGHVAYSMAPFAEAVTAVDLSGAMLAAVAATAQHKGLTNITTVESAAERLPFGEACFDFLACRYSAHHWQDFEAGIREARRVLKSGSPAVFMDVFASGNALFDTHLQAIELLRDTSHVRDYTAAQWMAVLGRSGFGVNAVHTARVRMDFATWIARMRTPPDLATAIRMLQQAASKETRAYFAIEEDGSFMLDQITLETTAL